MPIATVAVHVVHWQALQPSFGLPLASSQVSPSSRMHRRRARSSCSRFGNDGAAFLLVVTNLSAVGVDDVVSARIQSAVRATCIWFFVVI